MYLDFYSNIYQWLVILQVVLTKIWKCELEKYFTNIFLIDQIGI